MDGSSRPFILSAHNSQCFISVVFERPGNFRGFFSMPCLKQDKLFLVTELSKEG